MPIQIVDSSNDFSEQQDKQPDFAFKYLDLLKNSQYLLKSNISILTALNFLSQCFDKNKELGFSSLNETDQTSVVNISLSLINAVKNIYQNKNDQQVLEQNQKYLNDISQTLYVLVSSSREFVEKFHNTSDKSIESILSLLQTLASLKVDKATRIPVKKLLKTLVCLSKFHVNYESNWKNVQEMLEYLKCHLVPFDEELDTKWFTFMIEQNLKKTQSFLDESFEFLKQSKNNETLIKIGLSYLDYLEGENFIYEKFFEFVYFNDDGNSKNEIDRKKIVDFYVRFLAQILNESIELINKSIEYSTLFHRNPNGLNVLFNFIDNDQLMDFYLKSGNSDIEENYDWIVNALYNLSRLQHKFLDEWNIHDPVDKCLKFLVKAGNSFKLVIYVLVANIASDDQIKTLPELKMAIENISEIIRECASSLDSDKEIQRIKLSVCKCNYIVLSKVQEMQNIHTILGFDFRPQIQKFLLLFRLIGLIVHSFQLLRLQVLTYKRNKRENKKKNFLLYKMIFSSERSILLTIEKLFELYYFWPLKSPFTLFKTLDIQVNENEEPQEMLCYQDDEGIWNIMELLEALYHMSVNDTIKKEIYETYNMKGCLKKMIVKANNIEKSFSLKLLYQLCFDKTIVSDLEKDQEFLNYLHELSKTNTTDLLKKNCDGILWKIDASHSKEENQVKKIECSSRHIMISYNGESRKTCLAIKDELEKKGFKIWIDVENIAGSSLESMAKAIEESICILMGMTEKYKMSPNCRLEAEYAVQLNKPIIPLILQNGYKPDGWYFFLEFFTAKNDFFFKFFRLGIILGAKIFVNFNKYTFDECIRRVLVELSKVKNDLDNEKVDIKPNLNGGRNNSNVNDSKNQNLLWNEKEVEKWIHEKNFNRHIMDNLRPCNGKILYQMFTMLETVPEFFYSTIRSDSNNQVTLRDLAEFSFELKQLFDIAGKNEEILFIRLKQKLRNCEISC
ncbi:hypothetical protein BpHYR1_013375 [Brachionus plicatilis]|uniref:TIR domain-containing protein n=1 Tax=Brachionus plicatilis TaxID=10195 RepID=A0A3M7SLR0_BRAPC|nr:hypothetical protein BpHYR1_013375 [Brachionus plicatilis]